MKKHLWLCIPIKSGLFSICCVLIIGQSFSQVSFTTTTTNATVCTAPCNGTATANPSGGTPPYNYYWGTSPAQQTQTATGMCPGTYTVGVYDSTSPIPGYATANVTITCTQAVFEYVLNQFIELFPNPASENLSITLSYPNGGTVKEISVFNSIGEKVLNENFSSKKFSGNLSVRKLPAGVYFLELKDEKNSYHTKFIKE